MADLDIVEVEDLYDALVNGQHNDIDGLDNIILSVLTASPMDDGTLEHRVPFKFQDGAHFLWMDELNNNEICQIIGIFSELLKFTPLDDKKKGIHMCALPDVIATFVQCSWLDSGEHLMKQAHCHAMDPQNPSLLSCWGCICIDTHITG